MDYVKGIKRLEKAASFDEFRTRIHKLTWLIKTRPEIKAGLNILPHIVEKIYKEKI